jgi:AraC-like DNA-binding protein
MRALQKEISNSLYSHIKIVERKDDYFSSPFHFHTELELVYVKEGFGERIIGNKLDTFTTGEIFFVGSNLPHEWRNDEDCSKEVAPHSYSIVAYFNKGIFSNDFYNLRESNKINCLLSRAGRGIKVTGETRHIVAGKMEALVEKKDFERILGLMEILHILSVSNDIEYLVYEGYEGNIPKNTSDRLTGVFNYVNSNYSRDITLEEIARLAHLTPPAFCRLFKQKTDRPFVSYLNEVRISNACRYLTETDHNISEIAFSCGYKTISNFNRFFKKSTGFSPKVYRERTLQHRAVLRAL